MRPAAKVILPLLVLAVAGGIAWWLIVTKPEPPQRPVPPAYTRIEATRVQPSDYQVKVETQGVIRPRTETLLIPEVSGRVLEVASYFRDGGFFEKDDLLLKIDPLNYETAVVISESNVAQARTALAEEQARGEQALENWKRLGKQGAPSDLVLRKPQLAEMEARLKAAEAELLRARRDLERTEIRAPYAGRVLEQSVDVGQYVAPGTQLAQLYAVDYVEIRLPLTNEELEFVEIPEMFRGNVPDETARYGGGPRVVLRGELGGRVAEREGRIVRVEGAIDQRSRQLFVVAQVEDPYRKQEDGSLLLKFGMFVDAVVDGKTLENVFVLPRAAVRAGDEVILVEPGNRIRRQPVDAIWSDRDHVVVADGGGLKEGDVVCLTPLAFPANGAMVLPTIDGVAPEAELTGQPPGKGAGKAPAEAAGKNENGSAKKT